VNVNRPAGGILAQGNRGHKTSGLEGMRSTSPKEKK